MVGHQSMALRNQQVLQQVLSLSLERANKSEVSGVLLHRNFDRDQFQENRPGYHQFHQKEDPHRERLYEESQRLSFLRKIIHF